jgi:hypothetical protein
MATIKCKNCGEDIVIDKKGIVTCPRCNVRQTTVVPNSEKKVQVFNLAARLMYLNNYDKAYQLYDKLSTKFEEVEPFFGKVLCKYGVSFDNDELVCKKIVKENVLDNPDYLEACKVATDEELEFLENEALKINKFQKEFSEIASNTKASDIFILVDDTNRKAEDYVIAKEMYEVLKMDGKKVFFPRIALKDKVGAERGAMLYKAINSAKMMILFSTASSKLNSDKITKTINEYVSAMEGDSTKVLLPCLKGIKPENYPEAIKDMKVVDLAKDTFIDAIMDAVDAIFKVKVEPLKPEEKQTNKARKALSEGNFAASLKAVDAAIEANPDYEPAYEIGLFASLKIQDEKDFSKQINPILNNKYVIASHEKGFTSLDKYVDIVNEAIYERAIKMPHSTPDEVNQYTAALGLIKNYKDAAELIDNAYGDEYEQKYKDAIALFEKGLQTKFERTLQEAERQLIALIPYKDCEAKAVEAREAINKINDDLFKEPYDKAIELYNHAKTLTNYAEALAEYVNANQLLRKVLSYKDAREWNTKCREMMYNYSAMVIFKSEVVDEVKNAITVLNGLRPYKDSDTFITQGNLRVKDLLDPKKHKKK